MLVTRVGGLDQICSGVNFQHQVDEMLQLKIVDPRRNVDAVAGVEAHAILGDAAQCMIDRLDPQSDELAAVVDRGIDRAVVMRRHARIVDLQQEAGVDNRLVFYVHRICERRQILFVRGVISIFVVKLEIGRRDRRHERFLGRSVRQGAFQVFDIIRELFLTNVGNCTRADLCPRPHHPLGYDIRRTRREHHLHVFISARERQRVARRTAKTNRTVDFFEPTQPGTRIGHPIDFAVLTVIDNVDPGIRLLSHDF